MCVLALPLLASPESGGFTPDGKTLLIAKT
jgi:hypothetical protein